MSVRLSSWLLRPWALRSLFFQMRLVGRLLREPQVPALLKGIPLLAALYVVSPVDLMPDVAPVLGQLDDLGVVLIALELFRRLCPANAELFHREAILRHRPYSPMSSQDDVIEAEWRDG